MFRHGIGDLIFLIAHSWRRFIA